MKLKKIVTILVVIILMLVALKNITYATELNTGVTIGLIPLMDEEKGYSIFYPYEGANENGQQGAYIWNIVSYDSPNSTSYQTNLDLYSLQEGIGLGAGVPNHRENYNISYDMRTQRREIAEQNDILNSLVNGTVTCTFVNGGTIQEATFSKYDVIYSFLDRMKMQMIGSTSEIRRNMIAKAMNFSVSQIPYYRDDQDLKNFLIGFKEAMVYKNPLNNFTLEDKYVLTEGEVKAVQQAVIWYFTNHDKYDLTQQGEDWLYYIEQNGSNRYQPLKNYGELIDFNWAEKNDITIGKLKAYQADCLYHYLIHETQVYSFFYNEEGIDDVTTCSAIVNQTNLQGQEAGDNWIIGPIYFDIKGKEHELTSLSIENNGTTIISNQYKVLDENGEELGIQGKDLKGKNFYISIPKELVKESITIDMTYRYYERKMMLYASATNSKAQPIVDVEEKYQTPQIKWTFEPEKQEESFDLKLVKHITEVNGQDVPERIKNINVSKLNTLDTEGNRITTAEYEWNKEPVPVKKGDIVTYHLRVYNEGTIDGYAQEITENIPEGLEFIWSEKQGEELEADTTLTDEEKEAIKFNQKYSWGNITYAQDGKKIIGISSDYLSKEKETTTGENLIPAFGHNDDANKTTQDLHFKEIAVKFKVVAEDIEEPIINEAAILEDCDKEGNPVDDRDSNTNEWKEHPNHEDDEDHDYIVLQSSIQPLEIFDLALRKFIIAVSDDTNIDKEEELRNKNGLYTRAPIVDTSKLNTKGEDGKLITTATYRHTKEPLLVKPNDIVVYMLRVYNEGDSNGYASEIKDHLPSNLEFVESEFNEQYGWELSEDGRTATTRYLEDSLINKPETNEEGELILAYKEVPIMCKVSDTVKSSEKITNIADITEYLDEDKKPVLDRDSQIDDVKLPADKDLSSYKEDDIEDYIPGQQDDDDFEKVTVKVFDLALKKWVTEAIVIENGEQIVRKTGHQPNDTAKSIVKVEIHRKKLDQVTVKFKYSMRVYNEGEIEGYAKEVKDYIPEGLKFIAEDNPDWKEEGNNVISTRKLENTLLKPGEYADVEVLLTWKNAEDNMGVMVNTAEISEDGNEFDILDVDSTPNNKKIGEDDIDKASVMLSISTGQMKIYFTLGLMILMTTATGVVLIKRFVL